MFAAILNHQKPVKLTAMSDKYAEMHISNNLRFAAEISEIESMSNGLSYQRIATKGELCEYKDWSNLIDEMSVLVTKMLAGKVSDEALARAKIIHRIVHDTRMKVWDSVFVEQALKIVQAMINVNVVIGEGSMVIGPIEDNVIEDKAGDVLKTALKCVYTIAKDTKLEAEPKTAVQEKGMAELEEKQIAVAPVKFSYANALQGENAKGIKLGIY